MLWPKKNSWRDFDNKKNFLRFKNSLPHPPPPPTPITFLMVRPLHPRTNMAEVKVQIPASLNFFTLSFHNCTSCVFCCDVISFVAQFKYMKFICSTFHNASHFILWGLRVDMSVVAIRDLRLKLGQDETFGSRSTNKRCKLCLHCFEV